jgi:hypothetical protein
LLQRAEVQHQQARTAFDRLGGDKVIAVPASA